MSNTQEDKRKAGRREVSRRAADILEEILAEEDIRAHDRASYRSFLSEDRRGMTKRRSGRDRREDLRSEKAGGERREEKSGK